MYVSTFCWLYSCPVLHLTIHKIHYTPSIWFTPKYCPPLPRCLLLAPPEIHFTYTPWHEPPWNTPPRYTTRDIPLSWSVIQHCDIRNLHPQIYIPLLPSLLKYTILNYTWDSHQVRSSPLTSPRDTLYWDLSHLHPQRYNWHLPHLHPLIYTQFTFH